MGKIVISENVTLDGVVQDPTGEEGNEFGRLGGWRCNFGGATRSQLDRWGGDSPARP